MTPDYDAPQAGADSDEYRVREERQLRERLIQAAIANSPPQEAEAIVARAEKFLAFVMGVGAPVFVPTGLCDDDDLCPGAIRWVSKT